jgi:signal transduction histidine kinase/ActR/RegA family two-component response regulator
MSLVVRPGGARPRVVSDLEGMSVTQPAEEMALPPTALELSQALLELGPRLASADVPEAAAEALAAVLERALAATPLCWRGEPLFASERQALRVADEVRRSGQVGVCRIDGPKPFVLLLPIRTQAPALELLAFQRRSPFSPLEQSLAALGKAQLEAALDKRALADALLDCRTQLAQSERLKSIGQLASGVAHDFNNLLMVISATAEVMSDAFPPEHVCATQLNLILDTSHRAAELTRKLLRFSRKAPPAVKPIDMHEVLGTVREFLAHGIDRSITLSLSLCEGPCVVDADATELGNAILNVCLNARDAMPDGGLLKITTSRVELDAQACAARFRGCQPGPFVRLEVKDTGTGMDEQTLARAFDPFFTTKDPGRGTGLGLPVVLAAVREHKGGVLLESESGGGTSCSILLPLREPGFCESSSSDPDSRRMAALRVLLVDDEPGVCLTAAQLMRQLGHKVQALCSGEKALSHLRVHSSGYDLLVLDVMMPRPTGLELHRTLNHEGIDLPTIFVSGSTDLALGGSVDAASGAVLLAKPFRQAELALAIGRCMQAWQSRTQAAVTAALRAG